MPRLPVDARCLLWEASSALVVSDIRMIACRYRVAIARTMHSRYTFVCMNAAPFGPDAYVRRRLGRIEDRTRRRLRQGPARGLRRSNGDRPSTTTVGREGVVEDPGPGRAEPARGSSLPERSSGAAGSSTRRSRGRRPQRPRSHPGLAVTGALVRQGSTFGAVDEFDRRRFGGSREDLDPSQPAYRPGTGLGQARPCPTVVQIRP